MKQAILIAGPNGAGKTTFASEFLPREGNVIRFLNADMIAHGLSPFAPEHAAIEASKLLLHGIADSLRRGESFAVETTLSGRTYLGRVADWKSQGYTVILHYLKLSSVELAVSRVQRRVQLGGHDIPEPVIRRRYQRGLANLPLFRSAVDRVQIWNANHSPPRPE